MVHRDYELEKIVLERLQSNVDMWNVVHPIVEKTSYDVDDPYILEDLMRIVPHLESVNYGVSKVVLIFDDIDQFVVKIPFWSLRLFESYHCCSEMDFGKDYCKIEAKRYALAKRAKVNEMLCGTWYIGKVDGVYDIYLSERADTDYSGTYEDCSAENRIFSNSMRSVGNHFDLSSWAIDVFVNCYGGKKVEKLLNFISDNCVNDLHEGNIMFVGDKPKLIDYSSFDEDLD